MQYSKSEANRGFGKKFYLVIQQNVKVVYNRQNCEFEVVYILKT